MSEDWRVLDAQDPLREFRREFHVPEGVVYLDGNSLGALPVATLGRVTEVISQEWGDGLVRSWSAKDWIGAPRRIGDKIARLVGAEPHEVIVSDSTSVNLFKLIVAALQARPERKVVVSEPGNFPTDLYMVESALRLLNAGHSLRLVPREAVFDSIDRDTALLLLTQVHYKTAHVLNMTELTAQAHEHGALVLWDLCHSAGALPVALNSANADLAVGCGYKYLNGGPGAAAFLFVAERHQPQMRSPLGGWMGHARPFDFIDTYEPASGIGRFLCGTPSVLSLCALEVGIDLLLRADMDQVAAKSRRLGELFIALVERRCAPYGLHLAGPPKGAPRGSHVAFSHPHAYEIVQALIARGVIGDFRAPDLMRFGLTPLYLRYEDIDLAVRQLEDVLVTRSWDDPRYRARGPTT